MTTTLTAAFESFGQAYSGNRKRRRIKAASVVPA